LLLPRWFAEDADVAMELVDLNTVIPARCWRESSAIPLGLRTTNNHGAARNKNEPRISYRYSSNISQP